MAEHPISMTGWSMRAIRANQKTQTRRVMKPQPPAHVQRLIRQNDGRFWEATGGDLPLTGAWSCRCPYGEPGDALWCREKLVRVGMPGVGGYWAAYEAGCDEDPAIPAIAFDQCGAAIEWRWKRPVLPAIFMPRWACRETLTLEARRIKRLQDISEEDAKAEAAWFAADNEMGAIHLSAFPREAFQVVWDKINAKRGCGWDANPWVWVLTFSRRERPERSGA